MTGIANRAVFGHIRNNAPNAVKFRGRESGEAFHGLGGTRKVASHSRKGNSGSAGVVNGSGWSLSGSMLSFWNLHSIESPEPRDMLNGQQWGQAEQAEQAGQGQCG